MLVKINNIVNRNHDFPIEFLKINFYPVYLYKT